MAAAAVWAASAAAALLAPATSCCSGLLRRLCRRSANVSSNKTAVAVRILHCRPRPLLQLYPLLVPLQRFGFTVECMRPHAAAACIMREGTQASKHAGGNATSCLVVSAFLTSYIKANPSFCCSARHTCPNKHGTKQMTMTCVRHLAVEYGPYYMMDWLLQARAD